MNCKTPSADQTGSAHRTVSGERTARRWSHTDRIVLIVEADATLAAMMSELLDQARIKSEVVTTIKTMVARCRPSRVRSLIIDVDTVSLEWNDGSLDQLNTWLRVSPRSIPVLLATVHVPSDGPHAPNVHLPLAAPVQWIRKPFCNREFLTSLRALLRKTDPLPFA
jgi:DNA-binding response OmpR family regulator